jgi:hypothetical protein
MCSLLMLEACAKPPTEQIEAVEKAIKEVQANDASTYIPDEYTKIEGTLSALKEEVTHQDGKLALFREYGEVWQLVVTAKSEAERLKTEGTEKNEETAASALQAQQVAQEVVTTTLALVVKAPIGRDRAVLNLSRQMAKPFRHLSIRCGWQSTQQTIRPHKLKRKPFTKRVRPFLAKSRQALPRSERENPLRRRRSRVDLLYV